MSPLCLDTKQLTVLPGLSQRKSTIIIDESIVDYPSRFPPSGELQTLYAFFGPHTVHVRDQFERKFIMLPDGGGFINLNC